MLRILFDVLFLFAAVGIGALPGFHQRGKARLRQHAARQRNATVLHMPERRHTPARNNRTGPAA